MHNAAVGALLVGSLILQATVLPRLAIAGARPDLLLVVTILLGLRFGPLPGAGVGLAGGLLQDVLIGRFIGMNALTKGLTGYCIGLAEEKLFKENIATPLAAVLVGTITHESLFWLLQAGFGRYVPLPAALGRVIIPGALFNCFLAALILRLGRRPGQGLRSPRQ